MSKLVKSKADPFVCICILQNSIFAVCVQHSVLLVPGKPKWRDFRLLITAAVAAALNLEKCGNGQSSELGRLGALNTLGAQKELSKANRVNLKVSQSHQGGHKFP